MFTSDSEKYVRQNRVKASLCTCGGKNNFIQKRVCRTFYRLFTFGMTADNVPKVFQINYLLYARTAAGEKKKKKVGICSRKDLSDFDLNSARTSASAENEYESLWNRYRCFASLGTRNKCSSIKPSTAYPLGCNLFRYAFRHARVIKKKKNGPHSERWKSVIRSDLPKRRASNGGARRTANVCANRTNPNSTVARAIVDAKNEVFFFFLHTCSKNDFWSYSGCLVDPIQYNVIPRVGLLRRCNIIRIRFAEFHTESKIVL